MDPSTSLLAPFSDEDQAILIEMDKACSIQADWLKEDMAKASLAGEEYQIDLDSLVWLKVIKAYGILFNRALDSGWIAGVHLTGEEK